MNKQTRSQENEGDHGRSERWVQSQGLQPQREKTDAAGGEDERGALKPGDESSTRSQSSRKVGVDCLLQEQARPVPHTKSDTYAWWGVGCHHLLLGNWPMGAAGHKELDSFNIKSILKFFCGV